MLAYYYNQARVWGREVAVTYKDKDLQPGAGILDLERGRMAKITPFKWLNDDSVDWNSWCYVRDADIKDAGWLVHELVDIVSKNGNLLLNICPKPDGTIPEPIRESLLGLGRWLAANGEAIYGTRPWEVYGEGPLRITEGSFGERKNQVATAADVRFTKKGNAVYAICLAVPAGEVRIKTLAKSSGHPKKPVADLHLLGSDESLKWSQEADALVIQRPQRIPAQYALAFKVEFGK
jgi:alpha-L-fucosidase